MTEQYGPDKFIRVNADCTGWKAVPIPIFYGWPDFRWSEQALEALTDHRFLASLNIEKDFIEQLGVFLERIHNNDYFKQKGLVEVEDE